MSPVKNYVPWARLLQADIVISQIILAIVAAAYAILIKLL